jgi:TRAP-type C4-dicarboxylate transport system permease small subunit
MKRKPLGVGDSIVAGLFGAAILVVTAQVLWRYAFNNSLVWTEEASRYLFVWMTFLGAALAVKEQSHIGVTAFVDSLPERLRSWLRVLELALTAALLGLLAVVGFQWVGLNADTPTPALRLPLNYALYASLPVASLIGFCFAVQHLGEELRGRKWKGEEE